MKKRIAPKARKENLVVQELDGEVLIYDLSSNKAFSLNETSTLVWQLCDGDKSVSEISESISRKLNAPANEDLVWLALDQLKKEKLIANGEEIVPAFNGMSRREVVKKIGLGTMIALPLVSSLVAPIAALASSACPPTHPCSCGGPRNATTGNCTSTTCANTASCICLGTNGGGNQGTCGIGTA